MVEDDEGRPSAAELSLAEQLGGLGTWEWDVASNVVRWSAELFRIYGLDPERFGASFEAYLSLVHEDDRERVQRTIQRALESGEEFHFVERVLRPSGEQRELESVGRVLRDEEGAPLKLVGACMDITERNAVRSREQEREQDLAMALDAARMGAWSWDATTGEVFWSPEVEKIFGIEPGSFERTLETYMAFVVEEDRPVVEAAIDKAFASKDGRYSVRHRTYTPAGDLRWIKGFGQVFFDADGHPTGLRGLVMDVTEEFELEAQLLQAQKMETVGRLAGGVAHDFNNLLTVVLGELEMAQALVPADTPLARAFEGIHEASTRAARLTRQLLTLARKQPMAAKRMDLLAAVEERRELLTRLVGELVDVRVASEGRAWPVRMDPSQLDQLLLNLVANARDAMPRGGRLDLEVAELQLDPDQADELAGLRAGEWVRLRVNDRGEGISTDALARVFDPFFTTKEMGTGLGLSTCYGIVDRHGGVITIDSRVGEGTSVTVYLPRLPGEAVPVEGESSEVMLGGDETILLVEDDERLRTLTRRTIEAHGYRVLVAENGEDALARVSQHEGAIHLLLTDVVMPGMGGVELAECLRERLDLPVLFVSGYTAEAFTEGLPPRTRLLKKPYKPSELLVVVRECLRDPLGG